MIDCGEGTQRQFHKFGFHDSKLEYIFISHAHGDHCLGLIGMLSSMSLDGRDKDMDIYIPADLEPLLKAQIDFFIPHAEFEIHLHPVDCQVPVRIFSDSNFEVTALPLNHRVPCYGFLFREQQGNRHIKSEHIEKYGIPYDKIERIQHGEDFITEDGQVIDNDLLTTPPAPSRGYAYISDTRPMMEYAELLQGVDLIYHEATFCEGDEELACRYHHATASEAADFADQCGAGKLLLGHFSSRYRDETCLLDSAVKLFPHTMLANEGMTVEVEKLV